MHDTFSENQFSGGESLTIAKLRETLNGLSKVKYCAFTASLNCYRLILNATRQQNESNFWANFTSVLVIPVSKQIVDAIRWDNKYSLNQYLELMGERPASDPERINAIETLVRISSLPYDELVLKLWNIPTRHLQEVLRVVSPRDFMLTELVDDMNVLLKNLSVPRVELKKEKTKPHQPFYSKFTNRRRRK